MSKLIGEPVKVHGKGDSTVLAFIWRKRSYRVSEVIDCWREPSEWWNGKEVPLFVRVNAANSTVGTYELCRRGEQWFLHRVLD